MKTIVRLQVNGFAQEVAIDARHTLLDVLRREFKLFSVREGCGIGMCGACTVLIDGKPMGSCLLLAGLVGEREIVTVEALTQDGALHPIQQAFVDHTAFQCSYCTPGFILTTKALLDEKPDVSEAEVREYLSGNLCRCGSYIKIVQAVLDARDRLAGTSGG